MTQEVISIGINGSAAVGGRADDRPCSRKRRRAPLLLGRPSTEKLEKREDNMMHDQTEWITPADAGAER